MGIKYVFITAAVLICFSSLYSQQKLLPKVMEDQTNYTNIGNIGLSITNYGIYGNGLVNLTIPGHPPSCEYPKGSGIEHISEGGLWVGGFRKDAINSNNKYGPYVTTAVIDASSLSRGAGFEFTNRAGETILERSSIPGSPHYSPDAISHQDFVLDYSDTNFTLLNGTAIPDHNPLGIVVHEEDYAWNFPFADFFVIKNYTIKNVSGKYLDSVYVGMWTDAVVRNTKITTIKNAAFYSHGGSGYDDVLNIAYTFDVDGDVPNTNSYVGILYLGSSPTIDSLFLIDNGSGGRDTLPATCFNSWKFNNATDPNFYAPPSGPTGDIIRYQKMQGWFGGTNRFNPYYNSPGPLFQKGINPDDIKIITISGRSDLITHGYYRNIAPGESINIAYAVVCGKKYGDEPTSADTRLERTNLYSNADWALRTYYGNDWNRNGILDANENIYGDGKIHRFTFYPLILASPNAGEHYLAGYNHKITWVSNITGNVKLEYSTNSGASWNTIVSNTPANSGSYSWLVPNTPSANCRLRITSVENPATTWVSTNEFTISNTNSIPQISWNVLSTLPDTSLPVMSFGWDAVDPDGYENIASIQVALNDTNNFVSLDRSVNQITIKTNDFSNPHPLMDIIIDPTHVLQQKLPGIIFNGNNVLYLRTVDIAGGISPWISTQTQSPTHGWYVKKPRGKYLVINDYQAFDKPGSFYPDMMDSLQLSSQYDVLDNVNQKLPYVTATFMETLKLFDYVLWYSDNNPSLDLAGSVIPQYTKSGGKVFLSWLFPQTVDLSLLQGILPIISDSSSYLAMIVPNKMVSDTSHSGYPTLKVTTSFQRLRAFYLSPGVTPIYFFPNKEMGGYIGFESKDKNIFFLGMPLHKMNGIPGSVKTLLQKVLLTDFNTAFIRLNSPTTGEALIVGFTYRLSWNSNMVSNVKIEYTTDNGTSWNTITGNASGTSGSYLWTVPNTPSENCAIRISDVSNPAINGMNYFTIRTATGITDNIKSLSYKLQQNYPNPFNPSTTINYSLAKDGHAKITLYNILGSKVAVLVNENKPAGNYSVQFNASALPSGIYLYRLESGSYSDIKKFVLLK
jgi:hypothetical protein